MGEHSEHGAGNGYQEVVTYCSHELWVSKENRERNCGLTRQKDRQPQLFQGIGVDLRPNPHKPLTNASHGGFTFNMPRLSFTFPGSFPIVVGSVGDPAALAEATPASLAGQCDLAEIRLDLFHAEFLEKGNALWRHLLAFPLLFTARCHAEGSPFELDLSTRISLLRAALPDACMIDIEAVSAPHMKGLISEIAAQEIPWIASYHNFNGLPSMRELTTHAKIARKAGAAAFKTAAHLRTPDELAALARFQMSDQGIPLSTMGMGGLAPVSRLLCAQAGSVLNYGFVGENTTAPGQWTAKRLRECIQSLKPIS